MPRLGRGKVLFVGQAGETKQLALPFDRYRPLLRISGLELLYLNSRILCVGSLVGVDE